MKKKVILELVGLDGNAFALIGVWRREAKRQGWTAEEIKAVTDEAMSGDYNKVLATLMDNTQSEEEAGESAREQQRRDEKHGLFGEHVDPAN